MTKWAHWRPTYHEYVFHCETEEELAEVVFPRYDSRQITWIRFEGTTHYSVLEKRLKEILSLIGEFKSEDKNLDKLINTEIVKLESHICHAAEICKYIYKAQAYE